MTPHSRPIQILSLIAILLFTGFSSTYAQKVKLSGKIIDSLEIGILNIKVASKREVKII